MYLAANTRPDIVYAVHQAARHTHAPRASHSVVIKILRCLKGTRTKGIYFKTDDSDQVDCYVDADFAGLFSVEDAQHPITAKSRTGYVIMYSGVPVLWVWKMQTQIALSIMEAEYIALSQSMRDLIPVREILKDIKKYIWMKIIHPNAPLIPMPSRMQKYPKVKGFHNPQLKKTMRPASSSPR
jgi:hypothetical protein